MGQRGMERGVGVPGAERDSTSGPQTGDEGGSGDIRNQASGEVPVQRSADEGDSKRGIGSGRGTGMEGGEDARVRGDGRPRVRWCRVVVNGEVIAEERASSNQMAKKQAARAALKELKRRKVRAGTGVGVGMRGAISDSGKVRLVSPHPVTR